MNYLFFVFLLFHFGFKADKRNNPSGPWIFIVIGLCLDIYQILVYLFNF